MSAFWRPITGRYRIRSEVGELVRPVCELWCRCDICYWSGPSVQFWFAWQGPNHVEVCNICYSDPECRRLLEVEGYDCLT